MTAVLHTWSQNLGLHPHLHCIIPAGGVDENMDWKSTKSKGKYLFPAKIMATIYKAIFLKELKLLHKNNQILLTDCLKEKLYNKNWVVYAKKPFLNPSFVIEYLGRYTHKIAISNYRILNIEKGHITFHWKDYRLEGQKKKMTLSVHEFIRRFALHILPRRFVRIRHFGILSFHGRKNIIPKIQLKQGFEPIQVVVDRENNLFDTTCQKCAGSKLVHIIIPRKNRAP